MARVDIDELNILNNDVQSKSARTAKIFDYHDFILHYFDVMQISEAQRNKRIEAAEEITDAVLLFLMWCENAPDRVQEEATQRSFENMYKEVIFQYGEPDDYFDMYVPVFIQNLVETTLNHEGEEYFTSVERAANIAVNEANTVCNYTDLQQAKDLGYGYKQWIAELDERTRLDHVEMNGEVIPIDDYFVFEDCMMFMPHDEVNGTARQIVNCRCSLRYLK